MVTTDPLRNNRFLAEWLFLFVILLLLGGYMGHSQYQNRRQIEARERERLTSQTAVVETNLAPQILATRRAMDSILEGLPSWKRKRDGQELANQRLRILGDVLAGIRNILIIDADGRVFASNNEELIGRDFSRRDYFQAALKDARPNILHVTPPFKTVLDTFVISLYHIIPGPNGEFAGIVIASVDPEYFHTLLDSVRYAPDAWTYLAHGDGKLFMMVPERKDLIGKDLATADSFFTRHRNSGQSASVFAGLACVTGEERMIAFRTIQPAGLSMDKPLVVAVSRDIQSVFAGWYLESKIAAVMFGLLTLAGILSLTFYQRRLRAFDLLAKRQERERLQRQDELNNLLLEQSLIFDNLHAGVMLLRQRRIVKCNRGMVKLFGFDCAPAELEGKSTEIFFDSHEQFLAAGRVAYDKLARDGFAEHEMGMRCQDGRRIWVLHTGRPLNPAAVHEGSVWIYTDITERRQTEADLSIAATAFESREAMVITDAGGIILKANRAFAQLTGYNAGEVVGKTPRVLKSGRHNADFYKEMWGTLIATGAWQGEIWDKRKNGEEYPKWLAISAVRGGDGGVTHYVATHTDITERLRAEEKIHNLAYFDQLTDLPNRTLLLDRLKHDMATSARGENYCALLFIDLDSFKKLNDTLGHDMGDLLLKEVARRLTLCVREGDTVARLGGDEFMVALTGLGKDEQEAANSTETVAEKILAALNQTCQLKGVAYHSTASIGATLFKGREIPLDELMKQADLAMYKSKAAGRNAVCFFDPGMESAVKERAALEDDLRQGVKQKQFLLHYQAQVVGEVGEAGEAGQAGEERLTGAEVLIRWQHPQRGMVSPAEFIPLAEETGLILPLGRWVLETACAQLALWATRPEMAHLTVAVNVSAHQFRQADFVDQVLTILGNTGANPRRLKLELTESMLVHNVQEIVEKMFALKTAGVGFSMDDFGTGYSSLSYLKNLPLDQLKIDQSFVRNVLTDPNDAAIVRTVVALAQSLGLGVIAEGVETATQRDFLTSSGCHAYQGYFFSRPLPINAFEEFARLG